MPLVREEITTGRLRTWTLVGRAMELARSERPSRATSREGFGASPPWLDKRFVMLGAS